MSTDKPDLNESSRDEEAMARLLKLAGPRPAIDRDIEARVYGRVRDEWAASTGRRRVAVRWLVPLTLAASLLLALTLTWETAEPPPVRIGTVARATGAAAIAAGNAVYAGDTLSAGDTGGISLLLDRGTSLRLDAGSTLVADGRNDFTLLTGRVYADTGEFIYRDSSLRISTPAGTVTDIGTQFAVSIHGEDLDVAVREGRVEVTADGDTLAAIAGQRLSIPASGAAYRDALSPTDEYWQWAVELAPVFDIENRTLLDFLKWAARETGRELVIDDTNLRREVTATVLHGTVDGFTPSEAARSVLATTAFAYRIEPTRIVIER